MNLTVSESKGFTTRAVSAGYKDMPPAGTVGAHMRRDVAGQVHQEKQGHVGKDMVMELAEEEAARLVSAHS